MRRKPSIAGNLFELEALEPRVLLSADLLAAGAASANHLKAEMTVDEVAIDAQAAAQFGEKMNVVAYDPGAQVDDIFGDLGGDDAAAKADDLLTDDGTTVVGGAVIELVDNKTNNIDAEAQALVDDGSKIVAGTGAAIDQDSSVSSGSDSAIESLQTLNSATASVTGAEEVDGSGSANASGVLDSVTVAPQSLDATGPAAAGEVPVTVSALGVDASNPLLEQLTETLKSANGPPAAAAAESSVDKPFMANLAASSDSQGGSFVLMNRPVSTGLDAAEAATGAVAGRNIHLTPEHPTAANGQLIIGVDDTLSGSGTIVGDVVNRGLFSPGNSPGITTVLGDSTFARSGTVSIQIGGLTAGQGIPVDNGFDQINISGLATFGGTLQVVLINNFTPLLGQKFEIVTYGSAVSNFDNYLGLALGGGLMLKPTFEALLGGGGHLVLEVVQHSSAINRPLLFVPGFAGSFFADDTAAGRTEWFLNRGLSPTKLVLEPLTNAYSNLVQSLINVGYTLGVDLFVATWDWRLPVAKQDITADGNLTNVTGPGITDAVFETGVDYLGYWLNQALTTWNLLGNATLPAVDMITHSTGGLIARAYIESAAYGATYGAGKTLPKVFNFVESAAPNQGAVGTYLMLQDDFSQKASTRILGRTINTAFQAVLGGQALHNPDGSTITSGDLTAQGANAMRWFISHYVESLQDLIGTYAMLDLNDSGTFVTPTTANGGFQNKLLQDLKGGADPNAFVDRVLGVTNVVYSAEVQTDDLVVVKSGFQASLGLKNEILPFDRYLGDVPGAATTWYAEVDTNPAGPEGDGTVPTASAVGQFLTDSARLASGKLVLTSINRVDAGTSVGHSELVNNVFAQQKTIEALTGTLPGTSQISTTLEISRVLAGVKLLQYGLLDPVALGQEVYNRIKPLIAGLKASTRPDLETAINFIFNAVDSLSGGAGLNATVTTDVGAGKFGVVPAAGGENAYAYLALTQINFLAGTAGKGVALNAGKLGLLIFADGTYALDLSGTADIVGVTGLDFTGTIALQSNNSGKVDQSITVGVETVSVKFAQDTAFAFGGVLTLTTPVADVAGKFIVEISGSDIFVGATELTAFVGDKRGAGSADDVGLRLTDGRLALVIFSNQTYALDAAGTAALVNVPEVTASGTVSIRKNTSTTAVLRTVTVGLVTVNLDIAGSFTEIAGRGLEFGVAGFSVVGVFIFTQGTAPALSIAATGVRVAIGTPTLAELTGASGTLAITDTGLTGTARGTVTLDVPDVAFTGNFDLSILDSAAGQSVTVVGTGVTLTVLAVGVTGNFSIERTTTGDGEQVLKIAATSAGATFGVPAVVTFSGGSGAVLVRRSGVAARITGMVVLAAPVSSGAAFDLIFNTGSDTVNETFAGGAALTVPAGPYVRIAATGDVTITVSGSAFIFNGSFAYEKATRTSDGSSIVRLAASKVTVSFKSGGTTLAEITDGEGFFVFEATGFAGRVSGTLRVTLPGVSLTATAGAEVSTLGTEVTESIEVGGEILTLTVPAGPFVRFVATNTELKVAGQRVAGNFTFTSSAGNVTVAASGVEVSFGDGAGTFVTARAAAASLSLTTAGVTASISNASLDAALPGVDFGGPFSLALDTTVASPFVRVTGAASLTVLGATISGNFTVEQFTTAGLSKTVKVSITAVTLAFADGANSGANSFVNVTNGSGTLLLDGAGVAADFAVIAAVNIPGGVFNSTANARVQINTRASAVDESIAAPHDLVVPGGPFLRVELTGVTLTIAGNTLMGDFAFDQTTRAGGSKITRLAIANLNVVAGANSLTNGFGAFVLLPAAGAGTGGIAGFANGTVTGPGLSGNGGVRINKSKLTVDETVAVGGRTLTIRFGEAETDLLSFFAEDLTLNIGNFIVIQGSIGFVSTPTKETFAGEGIELYFGRGPPRLGNGDLNPLAQGILLRDATIGLVRYPGATVADPVTYALIATGTVEVVGVSGVTFNGTALVRVNTTAGAVHELLTFGTGHEVPVEFTAAEKAIGTTPFTQFAASNLELSVDGQTLTGDFTFEKGTQGGASAIKVTASHVTAAFGDGTTDFVKLSEGSGALLLTNAGAAGRLAVRAQVEVPGVSFDGTVALQINNTAVAVNEPTLPLTLPAGPYLRVAIGETTAATLTIAGQALSGKFMIERANDDTGATVTRIAASEVALKFGPVGTPFVNVINGHGSIIVRASGVAASLAATVTLNVPGSTPGTGAMLTGTFGLSINTGAEAVSESFVIGGETIALDLPAGPYLRVEARGVSLTLGGQRIGGDFAFEQVTKAASGKLTRIVIANASLSLGDGIVTVSHGQGALVIDDAATGLAGSFSGDVGVKIPGVSLSGSLSVQINDTAVAVDQSFSVGGETFEVNLPAGPYVRVVGTAISATLPGASLSGDFSIVLTTSVTPRLLINISNASVSLGGGLVRLDGASANFLVAAGGVAGSFGGTISVAIPNISFTGGFKVELNTIGLPIIDTLSVRGSLPGVPGPVSFNIPAGQFVRFSPDLSAPGVPKIEIFGQSFSGGFSIETDLAVGGVRIALNGVSLKLGVPGGPTFLDITGATGAFRIGGAGVAGSLRASAAIKIPGMDPITANVSVEVNTGALPVLEDIAVGSGSISLDLPAGPFVRVAVLDLTVRIGTVDLIGDFYFDQSLLPDGTKVTRFAVAGASITVSGNGIKHAEGAFVVKAGGFAGTLSGDLAVATGGASVSGRAGFRINTFTTAVNETIVVNGRPVAVVFNGTDEIKMGTTPFFGFFAENLVLNIGNFVTIEGTVNFTQGGGRSVFAGANLLVFMGQGPARLPSGALNPAATGVLISNARVGLIRVGTGYALNASGTVEVLGINGVTIAGQASVLVNTTGLALGETLNFPGDNSDPGVTLNFPTTATVTTFEALAADG